MRGREAAGDVCEIVTIVGRVSRLCPGSYIIMNQSCESRWDIYGVCELYVSERKLENGGYVSSCGDLIPLLTDTRPRIS
jgi:hypothetical protein